MLKPIIFDRGRVDHSGFATRSLDVESFSKIIWVRVSKVENRPFSTLVDRQGGLGNSYGNSHGDGIGWEWVRILIPVGIGFPYGKNLP